MGRHSKKTESHVRRNSALALSGLVPVGLIAAAHTAGATAKVPFLAAVTDNITTSDPEVGTPRIDRAAAETPAATPPPADIAPTLPPPPPAPSPVRTAPSLPTSLAAGALGIPEINLAAYQNAERILDSTQPQCGMYWTLIAGIGRVESTHAYDGKTDAAGNMLEPVLGPVLDGSLDGNAVIADTDNGALDGNANFDRAVGPTQFLPKTWNMYAGDGNDDGIADPQNVFDSALTTGKYLCDGGLDMRNPVQAAKAVHRYNNSAAYVANVLAWSAGYSTGIVPASSDLPAIH